MVCIGVFEGVCSVDPPVVDQGGVKGVCAP